MCKKNLRTLSDFLRKEKVSIIIGLSFGLVVTIGSNDNISSTVTAQAVDVKVLTDDDVRNSLSIFPSRGVLSRVESGHITISVKEQILVSQGYDEMASSANESYSSYEEKKRLAEEEAKRLAEEEAKRLAEEEAKRLAEEEAKRLAEEEAKRVKATGSSNTEVFKITGYCTCYKCCGNYSPEVTGRSSRTASGTSPCVGRTVAVDPDVIPLGSIVTIDGCDYIAEDTGSAVKGNVIDMYFSSHSEALNWGVKYLEVTYTTN